MSVPVNSFSNLLALSEVLQDEDLYEIRLENDNGGSVLYVGKNITPNADTAAPTWYIKKLSYDGNGFVDRVQLPDDGIGFKYAWDDRTNIFS
jgi:hypothetical protein